MSHRDSAPFWLQEGREGGRGGGGGGGVGSREGKGGRGDTVHENYVTAAVLYEKRRKPGNNRVERKKRTS